jgi:hypothetical protein
LYECSKCCLRIFYSWSGRHCRLPYLISKPNLFLPFLATKEKVKSHYSVSQNSLQQGMVIWLAWSWRQRSADIIALLSYASNRSMMVEVIATVTDNEKGNCWDLTVLRGIAIREISLLLFKSLELSFITKTFLSKRIGYVFIHLFDCKYFFTNL